MRKFNVRFIYIWFNFLIIAIVIIADLKTAKAQDNAPVLNGLFTPTSAQEFFQAGREDFEKEVEIFTHPEYYLTDDLLQFNPELMKQMLESSPPSDVVDLIEKNLS